MQPGTFLIHFTQFGQKLEIVNVRGFPAQKVANLFQMTSNRKWLIKRGKSWWH